MHNSLKVLRAGRDWSQADLAERLGVSRQTVNALETGRYDPSLPLAFRIARLFEQPIESIFDPGDGPGGDGQPPAYPMARGKEVS
jgi:putative transcriptional regulator